MAEQEAGIESPEDTLLAAIMAPDTQDVDKPGLDNGQSLDDDGDEDEAGEDETGEGDQAAEKQAKDAKEEQAEAEEDYIEIEGEEGAEPTKLKLADVLKGYQEYQRIEGQKHEIVERVERHAVEQATARLKAIEQAGQHTAVMIEAALRVLQEPQPPPTELLDPNSRTYNPDKYHIDYAHYQRAMAQHGHARQVAGQLWQQANQAQAKAQEERETVELQRLQRAWPEFGQAQTLETFVADMGKAYGFTPQELDAVLTDHRQALVAKDALAFRAMKAAGKGVKATVQAKAPKLVRTKHAAKGGATQRDRSANGQYVGGALAELKKTNSDDAAAAYFAGLLKAGRI